MFVNTVTGYEAYRAPECKLLGTKKQKTKKLHTKHACARYVQKKKKPPETACT